MHKKQGLFDISVADDLFDYTGRLISALVAFSEKEWGKTPHQVVFTLVGDFDGIKKNVSHSAKTETSLVLTKDEEGKYILYFFNGDSLKEDQ